MSADLLREAAVLMRERAMAAKATGVWRGDQTDKTSADAGSFTHHVATFGNPAVALAVADWLAETARRWEWVEERDLALTLARAYLGGDA